jgi:predicted alpha/beta superfamily hydrolase
MKHWRQSITGLLLACCLPWLALAQDMPQPESGRIERLANLTSRHVDARHIDVWLPRDFDAQVAAGQRFNVLYMHDGQMLFDARTTWNKQAWQVDRALSRLMDTGQIGPTLVVGIWNNGPYRHSEYFPQKHLQHMAPAAREQLVQKALQGQPRADAYLRFLVQELKPLIDARYPTHTDPAHTVVMGSSMGGLISVYAMNEYPHVFGAAAGLSTHWVGSYEANSDMPHAALAYLREHLADPRNHKLYQDHGTTQLDALYAPYQGQVDQLVRAHGYTNQGPSPNFMSRVFEGTGHNEQAWADRLEIPLLFVLGR